MSKKVALLIGVSEYGEGIPSLSAPINDVAAMKRVLENPEMGGFDEVELLINPEPTAMRLAVQQLFVHLGKDDLVLLFFSGHGITDDNNRLYLTTKGTSKDYYQATSVPASFIQDRSLESYTKRQVIILDCCYSGAFAEGWQAKSVGLELKKELGGEGRVVLTSSTATQTSFQQEGEELSLYTKYLVEGMETGAADRDEDGQIHAHELHEYAKTKVQEEKPRQKPGIILDKEGFNILLSQAPVNDPELLWRKLVEKYAAEGKIEAAGKYIVGVKQQELGIMKERADEIIEEVLAPYQKRLENRGVYGKALREEVEQNYPLNERQQKILQELQNILGLEDQDIAKVQQPILAEKEAEYQSQQEAQQKEQEEYEKKLQQYEQEFFQAVEQEYAVSEDTRNELQEFQELLGLREEDVEGIEKQIVEQKKAEARKQKEEERIRQKQKAEEERRPREKAEQLRQQQSTTIAPPRTISRKQFLKWAGWGGGGLVVTLVASQIFKEQAPLPAPANIRLESFDFEVTIVNAQGEVTEKQKSQAKFFKEELWNRVTLEMVSIPGGKFLMGTEEEEIKRLVKKVDWDGFRREKPQQEVTVKPFFMGRFQVTQAQWKEIASLPKIKVELEPEPSYVKGDDLPVEQVSWSEAVEFGQRLSKLTRKEYRLPSEAEWEYACRAGTTTPFHFGETITDKLANYDARRTYAMEPKGEFRQKITPVGSFSPNAFGLYDMHGQVWEWCEDNWHENYQGAPKNGSVWLSGDNSIKVIRGGSWNSFPSICRSACRNHSLRDYRGISIGFRIVCVV